MANEILGFKEFIDEASEEKKQGRRKAGSWGRPGSKKQKRSASKAARRMGDEKAKKEVNEAEGYIGGSHNAALPGVFTADMLGATQAMGRGNVPREDTKKENRRNAPDRKSSKMNLRQYLTFRVRAEDEEEFDDETEWDFDYNTGQTNEWESWEETESGQPECPECGSAFVEAAEDPRRDRVAFYYECGNCEAVSDWWGDEEDAAREEWGHPQELVTLNREQLLHRLGGVMTAGQHPAWGAGRSNVNPRTGEVQESEEVTFDEAEVLFDEVEALLQAGMTNPHDIADKLNVDPRYVGMVISELGDYLPQEEEETQFDDETEWDFDEDSTDVRMTDPDAWVDEEGYGVCGACGSSDVSGGTVDDLNAYVLNCEACGSNSPWLGQDAQIAYQQIGDPQGSGEADSWDQSVDLNWEAEEDEEDEVEDPNNPFNNYDENMRRNSTIQDFMSGADEEFDDESEWDFPDPGTHTDEWNEQYGPTGLTGATCPSCQSDNTTPRSVQDDMDAHFHECNDCGHRSDWWGEGANDAREMYGEPLNNPGLDNDDYEETDWEENEEQLRLDIDDKNLEGDYISWMGRGVGNRTYRVEQLGPNKWSILHIGEDGRPAKMFGKDRKPFITDEQGVKNTIRSAKRVGQYTGSVENEEAFDDETDFDFTENCPDCGSSDTMYDQWIGRGAQRLACNDCEYVAPWEKIEGGKFSLEDEEEFDDETEWDFDQPSPNEWMDDQQKVMQCPNCRSKNVGVEERGNLDPDGLEYEDDDDYGSQFKCRDCGAESGWEGAPEDLQHENEEEFDDETEWDFDDPKSPDAEDWINDDNNPECPMCDSTDIFTNDEYDGGQAYYYECGDCGAISDWWGPDSEDARARYGHPDEIPHRHEDEEKTMNLTKWLAKQDDKDIDDDEDDVEFDIDDEDSDEDEFDDEDITSGIDDEDEYEDFEDDDPDDDYDDDALDGDDPIDDEDSDEGEFDDEEDNEFDELMGDDDPEAEDLDDEDFDFDFEDEDDVDELDFDSDERSEHDLDHEFRDDDEDDDEEDDDEDEDDVESLLRSFLDKEREEEEEDKYDDVKYDDVVFDDDEVDNEDDFGNEEDDFDNEEDDFGEIADQVVDSIADEVIDNIDDTTGSIAKWWREQVVKPAASSEEFDDEYEEEQEVGPGGIPGAAGPTEPGAAVGPGIGAGPPKIDKARILFQQLVQRPDITRGDIIASFVQDIDVTQSTAVSYYERLAKEAGLTGEDGLDAAGADARAGAGLPPPTGQTPVEQLPADIDLDLEDGMEVSGDPNRQGIIRTVDNAHLVYKRQSEDGTFEELWNYNIGSGVKDELKVRRAILAGTDIPQNRTRSEDGSQAYELSTMGNAQILHITGLPN